MSYISAGNTTTTTLIQGGDLTGNLVFATGGANTAALTIDNTQKAAFANGISFTGNPGGGTAGTLNDYESGTWVPTDASGAGLSLTVGAAFYIKVGQLAFISTFITYPATASGSTAAISLPFTSYNTSNGYQSLSISYSSGGTSLVGYPLIGSNATSFNFRSPSNLDNQLTNANLSGKVVIVSGCYRTNV